MRVCHGFTAVFDDPNLVSCAGLAPVLQLAERAGLQRLVAEHVRLDKPGGVNPHLKIPALVAGMVAGADSIDDMALLRHGAMRRLFTGVRAPSTLGTFLRTFTFGHVRQLDAVASRLLVNLAGQAPLLPGASELAYVDVDDTLRQTYGYAKQGAGRGYTGVKGLNALLAIVSTPTSAPVIAAARLRKGSTNSARGAARLRRRRPDHRPQGRRHRGAGAAGRLGVLRPRRDRRRPAPGRPVLGHRPAGQGRPGRHRQHRRRRLDKDQVHRRGLRRAAATLDQRRRGRRDRLHRVHLQAQGQARHRPADRAPGQGPEPATTRASCSPPTATTRCSPTARCRCSPPRRPTAAHAIVEQVIADLKNGPLAHLPSGHFWANSAWLVCATIAFNLTRAAGALASAFHAKATTGTIRAQLIAVPGRLARSARRLTLHLPDRLALAEGLAAARRRSEQPTPRGLTHPPVRQDPTGDHRGDQPARPATPSRPHPTGSNITTDAMITEGPTVDPG